MIQVKPSFEEEINLWNSNIPYVIGIDEVGRGAFAGPIVGAGVIFAPSVNKEILEGINDSKLLTPLKRAKYSEIIKQNALHFAIEEVDVDFINKFGIGKANREVFHRVLKNLIKQVNSINYFCLIDGYGFDIPNHKGIIKGDQKSISIASASIIAKVYRDELMVNLGNKFPEYLFKDNKGYGTLKHRNAISELGSSPFHRTSFID